MQHLDCVNGMRFPNADDLRRYCIATLNNNVAATLMEHCPWSPYRIAMMQTLFGAPRPA